LGKKCLTSVGKGEEVRRTLWPSGLSKDKEQRGKLIGPCQMRGGQRANTKIL